MGDPEDKKKHSKHRYRNFIAKKMRESKEFVKRIHKDAKTREKERKFNVQKALREAGNDYDE